MTSAESLEPREAIVAGRPARGSVRREIMSHANLKRGVEATSALPWRLIFVLILGAGLLAAYALYDPRAIAATVGVGIAAALVAAIASSSVQVADQWNRALILRLGRFPSLRGPGLFFIVPFIVPVVDAIPYWIDIRVIASGFKAEKTLTKEG